MFVSFSWPFYWSLHHLSPTRSLFIGSVWMITSGRGCVPTSYFFWFSPPIFPLLFRPKIDSLFIHPSGCGLQDSFKPFSAWRQIHTCIRESSAESLLMYSLGLVKRNYPELISIGGAQAEEEHKFILQLFLLTQTLYSSSLTVMKCLCIQPLWASRMINRYAHNFENVHICYQALYSMTCNQF